MDLPHSGADGGHTPERLIDYDAFDIEEHEAALFNGDDSIGSE